MIISISGKIGSGKDTVGKIIQYLTSFANKKYTFAQYEEKYSRLGEFDVGYLPTWKIVKFADALKDIVCILTGCTREQLEDIDFKNSKLHDEWIRYFYTSISGDKSKLYNTYDDAFKDCPKQFHLVQNEHFTYRELLQYLGTDLLRNQLHEDVWINALMNKYKPKVCSGVTHCALAGKPEISCNKCPEYPNWIITDVRYKNEAEYIKNKGGILIRINRWVDELIPKEKVSEMSKKVSIYGIYPDGSEALIEDSNLDNLDRFEYFATEKKNINNISETDLDNYDKFDFIIDNNSFTIEILIDKVKSILQEIHLI